MIYSVPNQTINIALLDVRVDSMAPRLAGGWGRYFIRSFLWFPILQWQNKTFCKFWYFESGKGLKLLVTIIVTGNNKWLTSFCFLSWFRKNEMWRNKTFQLNIKSWHRNYGLLQPIMFPNIYCTVLSYFQSQTVL